MPITEWLTPKFFDVNVILVTLMINWTLYSIVSNFLEDFHIPEKVQAANYFGVVVMTVMFFIFVLVFAPTYQADNTILYQGTIIYPNKFNWLVIGNGPALGAILTGIVSGVGLGWLLGDKSKLLIGAAVAAVACEGVIGLLTLQWILNQT